MVQDPAEMSLPAFMEQRPYKARRSTGFEVGWLSLSHHCAMNRAT